MTDAPGNVVPFGKYRGQPFEVMLADRAYCEWAMAQPGIRERYPTFVTIVVNGGAALDAPTPQHNRLQLLFRDPAIRVATVLSVVDSGAIHDAANWLWEKGVLRDPREFASFLLKNGRVEFEAAGWDVLLDYRDSLLPVSAIELKPQIGDDYPAILRAMKLRRPDSDWSRALIGDYFEAEEATFDDVKWLFAQSQIVVKTLAEIRASAKLVAEEGRQRSLWSFAEKLGVSLSLLLGRSLSGVYISLEDDNPWLVKLTVLPHEPPVPAIAALIKETEEEVLRQGSEALRRLQSCERRMLVIEHPFDGVGFVAHVDDGPPSSVVEVFAKVTRNLSSSSTRGHEVKLAKPSAFRSQLRPLSIVDYERMSAAQLQRREKLEEDERLAWIDAQRRKPRPAGAQR